MTVYSTIQGDTWDVVALKTLGSEMYMSRIIERNIEYEDTIVFPAGVKLIIPDVGPEASVLLPPWKR